MKRNEGTKIAITINGERKEYKNVTKAAQETGFSYSTIMNWLHGRSKPSEESITIEKIEK